MKKIVIIGADNAVASHITGVMDFFQYCNTYWQISNRQISNRQSKAGGQAEGQVVADLFECKLASPDGQPVTTSSGIMINAYSPDIVDNADAILIASAHAYDRPSFAHYLHAMQPFFKPLHKANHKKIPIGAFCSGTFVLAETGILDNHLATTAWWLSELFHSLFPKVELTLDKIVVQQDHLYTGGATTAYLSLCLKLLEQMAGEQIAAQMARIILVDPNRASQIPFMSLQQLKGHKDEQIGKIQQWMQSNLSETFSLDELAERFSLTKRTLMRRFKQAVGDTPVNYLQRLRVEEAKRLLETSAISFEVIVNKVGYGDVSTFRKLFVQLTQLSPKVYRERFNVAYG